MQTWERSETIRAHVGLEWIADEAGLGADSLERGDGGLARLCEHRARWGHSVDSRCDSHGVSWFVAGDNVAGGPRANSHGEQ